MRKRSGRTEGKQSVKSIADELARSPPARTCRSLSIGVVHLDARKPHPREQPSVKPVHLGEVQDSLDHSTGRYAEVTLTGGQRNIGHPRQGTCISARKDGSHTSLARTGAYTNHLIRPRHRLHTQHLREHLGRMLKIAVHDRDQLR